MQEEKGDDLFLYLLLASAFCSEIFFIFKDTERLKKFLTQDSSKKEFIKYMGFGFLRIVLFLAIVLFFSVLLNCIPALYYWAGRNEALLKALQPELNSAFRFFRFVYWFLFPVSLGYVTIIKIKKKRLALSIVFPIMFFFGLVSFVTFALDYEYKYYRNPLADTKVSSTFKPLNVPLLKEGMKKEEVYDLLGYPLSEEENLFIYAEPNGRGWYDYLCLDVYFENDIVIKIDKRWKYED